MLPLRARVDLGAMAIKGYSAFPKLQHLWNLTIRLISVIYRTFVGGGASNPSAEVQSVFSTFPADWASDIFKDSTYFLRVLIHEVVLVNKYLVDVYCWVPDFWNFGRGSFCKLFYGITSRKKLSDCKPIFMEIFKKWDQSATLLLRQIGYPFPPHFCRKC